MKRSLTNPKSWFSRAGQISVLRLYGPIGASSGFGRSLNHASLERSIEAAFEGKRIKAVALAINSPGGAPGQSSLIARHIRRLADEKKIPVIAFCEDVAASGGYLLACAADEIHVNEYAVTGSIGVISASFGAVEAIDKIGVERRVHTAGKSKVLMDPFSPEKPEDIARLKGLQKDIHRLFIDWVKGSRKDKLDTQTELFEGDVWVGARAIEVGLVDAVGELRPVMRERFGKDVTFKECNIARKGLLGRLMGRGAAAEMSAGATDGALDAVEARLSWARFGL